MKWNNLMDMKCPKCKCALVSSTLEDKKSCGNPKCRFSISNEKFESIIENMYKPIKLTDLNRTEEQNLEELNNL